jgi:DNA-directed RNA polymerase specialized sigma24 family protein
MMTMAGKQPLVDFNHPDFLQSIKRREPSHWAQLYDCMQAELYAFFRTKLSCGDEQDLDDCITEVFSRAYAEIETFQNRSDLKSWLMHFARCLVRARLRVGLQQPVSPMSARLPGPTLPANATDDSIPR